MSTEVPVPYPKLVKGRSYSKLEYRFKNVNSKMVPVITPIFFGEFVRTEGSRDWDGPYTWSVFSLDGKERIIDNDPYDMTYFLESSWERRKEFALFWRPLAVESISTKEEEEEEDKRIAFMEDPANRAFLMTKMAAVFFSPDSSARRTIASYL